MPEKSLALTLIEEAIKNQSKTLDLGNCGLTDESPELKLLAECSFLEILNLGDSFSNANDKWIMSVNFGGKNNLSFISSYLPVCLRKLSLWNNSILKIENLENLINLRHLEIGGNRIARIENLDRLTNLLYLGLGENQITKIENLENLNKLKILYLWGNDITKIEGLDFQNKLVILGFHSNNITKIENLENLTQLSQLHLGSNQISKIENLDKLNQLSELHLSSNQISKIENLEALTNLSQIDLRKNQIGKIENLDKLPNLSQIDLWNNQIGKIENLDALTELSALNLGYNKITKIENLEKFTKLSQLDLRGNKIKDVSTLKSIIYQLEYLGLYDNPLENLNFQKFNDIKIWRDYFKSLEENEENKDRISYIKINIIGDGRIGKTQFINYLTKKYAAHKDDETEGVKTDLHRLGNNTVNLWDFGGQNYYHGSHRIMIRPQDINLVMWSQFRSLSKTDEPFRGYNYWLGTAHAYSTEADKNDVFLLQSVWNDLSQVEYEKIDKDMNTDSTAIVSEQDMKSYKVCPDHIFALDVFSTKKGEKKWLRSWNNFLETLTDHIEDKLKNRQTVSKKLIAVNEDLINYDGDKFIFTEEEFFAKFNLTSLEVQSVIHYWLSVLEFTGAILYLKEIEGLKKKIILPPYKLSEFIHQKLNLDKTDRGKMTKTQLQKVFNEGTDDVLLIMEHYNLFFLDAKDKNTYVFPQYLSDENTAFKKALLDLVPYTFSLTFPDYFHEGRFFEFMSEYGQFAIDQSSYWKYGILFQKPDETSITSDPKETEKINKNPKAIVYYDRLNMTITVHIEDKKGKAELAKELFNQFAYKEKIYIDEHDPITTDGVIFDIHEAEVKYKKGRGHRDKIINYDFHRNLILSTSSYNSFDGKKTKENLEKEHYFGYNLKTKRQEALDLMTLNLLDNEDKKKHRIFFSYSHKDEVYRDELEVHFAALKRLGYIETWHDRKILPGQDWDREIEEQILQSDIVLLLVSPDFINSDYIWNRELGLLKNPKFTGKVIPLLLRPCDTKDLNFMGDQCIPRDKNMDKEGKSKNSIFKWVVSSHWHSRDEAYLDIATELRNIFESHK